MIGYKDILNREFYYLDFESNKAGNLFLLGIIFIIIGIVLSNINKKTI